MTALKCPICSAAARRFKDKLFDDRFGCPGFFELYRCISCGHKHLHVTFSDVELAELYNSFYPRVALHVDSITPCSDRRGLTAWLEGENSFAYKWVPQNMRVLDLGCGFGETLGYHKQRGCEVFGVETDENVRLVAEKFGCTFHAGLFNSDNYAAEFFDYVTLDQVVEHFAEPVESMRAVAKIMRKGGVAVICTPNPDGWGAKTFGRRWINWHAPYHLQLFSARSMELLAGHAGFRLESRKTITSASWLYYQLGSVVGHPAPGKLSPFWSSVGSRSIGQKTAFTVLDALNFLKVPHLVTRVFDALGAGDNNVFLLKKIQ